MVKSRKQQEIAYISAQKSTSMSKAITQPVACLTLFALVAMACPAPIKAQETTSPNRLAPSAPSLPTTKPLPQPNVAPGNNPAPTTTPVAPTNNTAPTATPIAPGNTTAPLPSVAPANTPAGAPAANQPAQAPVDYALGGGDRIRINVFEVPEYTGDYQIPPGGQLFLPLVGPVDILGLTQAEAADAIAAKYSRYLKRPLVTVSLLSPRPINVVIAGEVVTPGSYTVGLQGGAGDNPGVQYPTIVGALTLAQGVTLAADLRQVQLKRKQGLGPERIINLDLMELVRKGTLPQDITLRDGDVVFVPTASEVNMADIRAFSNASFAMASNRPRTVTVVGEVNRPGSYVVIGGGTAGAAATTPGNTQGGAGGTIDGGGGAGGGLPTVSRAIQLAGGITSSADVRNIQIRRPTRNGGEQKMTVSFWRLLQGDPNQDTIVQEGDTVIVSTATNISPADATALADASFSPATIQVSVVGEVKTPGLVNLQPNTPLNQALLTAGGFDNARAKKGSADLIRLNPDGTVTSRRVKLDFSKGINDENNPTMRDNDIIVVRRNSAAGIGDTIGSVFGPVLSPLLGIVNVIR
jgi:polysaccharide biosynthesis/export protein